VRVVHPGASRAINQAVRQAFIDMALLVATPCDAAYARQRPGQVFWSWLPILEPHAGTLALCQPVGLAHEVASAILSSPSSEPKLDEVLDAQCELTNVIAGRAFTSLLSGQQVHLGTPSSGEGAPDVRQGEWMGQTFAVGDSWVAVFLSCPTLFAQQLPLVMESETTRLGPSESPRYETESVSAALEAKPDSPARASVRGSFGLERKVVVTTQEPSKRVEAPVVRSEHRQRTPLPEAPAPAAPVAPAAPARAVVAPAPASTPPPPPPQATSAPRPPPTPPAFARAAGPLPVARPVSGPRVPGASAAPSASGVPPPAKAAETPPSGISGRRSVVRTIGGLRSADDAAAPPPTGQHPPTPPVQPAGYDDFVVPGTIGHYRVLERIGTGPQSMVLHAEHRTLTRPVALKVMRPSLVADQAYVQRFLSEARIAAALEHPNLVTVYDAAHEGGFLYIAMRHIAGGSLAGLLAGEGVIAEQAAIALFADCLRALDFLHSRGLVHGNLHPGNILIDEKGAAHIVDVGVVRGVGEAPSGTAGFRSPEQLSGAEREARHDLYSLGVTLYLALSGKHPYQDGDSVDSYILGGAAADVRLHAPQASQALSAVIAKAIDRQSDRRYDTARRFLDDLLNAGGEADNQLSNSGVNWFGKLFGGKGGKP
jgi:Protein kinase domain/Chemotaxis phosphatase CheX